jgi:RNA polymerase-interacting CarD/CdnL/TRCF family regulator
VSEHRRAHHPDRHKASSGRRLAHLYGELVATADEAPLASRERRLLEAAARVVRTTLRTAREDEP